jgi:hypothetical protein
VTRFWYTLKTLDLIEEKKEKIISRTLFFKTPTPFDAAKCKLVDKTIRGSMVTFSPT